VHFSTRWPHLELTERRRDEFVIARNTVLANRGRERSLGVKMGSSTDVLMIEAPPAKPQGRWRNPVPDDLVDALPYIDHDYADPKLKAEVDKLIEEEMRRSTKRPPDYLADFPPAPTFDFEVSFCKSVPNSLEAQLCTV
jgi:hypothetical protein